MFQFNTCKPIKCNVVKIFVYIFVNVIECDPLCKDGNALFTTVPLNLSLINNVEDIVVVFQLKCLILIIPAVRKTSIENDQF